MDKYAINTIVGVIDFIPMSFPRSLESLFEYTDIRCMYIAFVCACMCMY